MPRPVVFLFRTAIPDDPYLHLFTESGFAPHAIPVLTFDFVNEAALTERLQTPDAYSGLVLTSPRAVEAMARARTLAAAWQRKKCYTVGPATAAAARTLGLQPEGEDAGTGAVLAAMIGGDVTEKPLLFLCGHRRREVLPEILREKNRPLEELVVYRTTLSPVTDTVRLSPPDWLVFFSPSGVEAVAESDLLESSAGRAAIGPTTAEALHRFGFPAHAVAAAPTPEALLASIQAAREKSFNLKRAT